MKVLICTFIAAAGMAAQDAATAPPKPAPTPAKAAATATTPTAKPAARPLKKRPVTPIPKPGAGAPLKPGATPKPGAAAAAKPVAQMKPRPATGTPKPVINGIPTPVATATAKPAGAPKPKPAVAALPKDAVETSPGFYRWTDKDGKVWTYRRTPFGVSRWPAESVSPQKQDVADNQTTAVEQGDSIRFERASPFGKRSWVRKKTELNDNEQMIWARQQKTGAATPAAEKE